ncbi:serine/threonine protein kinase [Xenorhabdus bovienii]|uniref:serine/threonine protein kinase n=1 Tax=Xenorhabdus bovienii TaxID=40576 RepID=UPI003BABC041|nr:serine/threonine protein kinase [Xenorhabdus bovienii]
MLSTNNNLFSCYTLPIGYCFDEFEIEKVIGNGGFGIVYRAWDHRLKRSIAIKEYMPASLAVRAENLQLTLRRKELKKKFQHGLNDFIREAHFMSCFNHPCLPLLLRFWQKNATAYIATPFYNGLTLKAVLATQPKTINEYWLRNILPPLFDAINTLHQAGYLHCDIALDNILIQENGAPILLDLGSVRKMTKRLSNDSEVTIRPGFTPIEQYLVDEKAQQGPWTDIYALGATLYTLITGSPPPVSLVRNIEDHYQPLIKRQPAGYSAPFLHAIDRALTIQPLERPISIAQLATLTKIPVATSWENAALPDKLIETQSNSMMLET